jgi:hypothetical protein
VSTNQAGRSLAFSIAVLVACIAGSIVFSPRPAHSHIPITTTIVFKREVAQILQRKCFQCHTDRNLAMPLTTYREARPWARAIREEILERRMPPWQAVSGHGRFANDISLTSREIDLLVAWVDGGGPSGMPRAEEGTPPVPVTIADGWEHGEPDVVRELPAARTVTPGAADEIARVVLSSGLDRARWLRGVAFRPGDRRVVRAATIYDYPTSLRPGASLESGQWLGSWTPWLGTTNLPDGVAYRLAPGARVMVEIHYRAAEEAVADRSAVGLYFAYRAPAEAARNIVIASTAVSIPARATRHRLRLSTSLRADTAAFAVWPELGEGGRSLEMTAVKPDGVVQPLLWIQDYRRDWPTPYIFQTPVSLPRGTTISVTAYFDNAADRPLPSRLRATLAGAQRADARRR